MGQCGCGDFYADYRLPGPPGFVYALQVYTGCRECGSGPGVAMHRFTEAEAKRWHVHELPELKLDGDCNSILVKVLDPEKLKRRMARFARKHGKKYDPDGLVEDAVNRTLIDAVLETREAEEKRRR